MTKLEQLQEKLADKTLSFGCSFKYKHPENKIIYRIFHIDENWCKYVCTGGNKETYSEGAVNIPRDYLIIGHPVTLLEVRNAIPEKDWLHLILKWRGKTLEDQDDKLIDWIFAKVDIL